MAIGPVFISIFIFYVLKQTDKIMASSMKKSPKKETQRGVHEYLPFSVLDSSSVQILPEHIIRLSQLAINELLDLAVYAQTIVETAREAMLVLDKNLYIHAANPSFLRLFEVSSRETLGKKMYELGGGEWDIPELRTLLDTVLSEKMFLEDYIVTHSFERIGERTMKLNARRLLLPAYKTELILLAIEDVSENRLLEKSKEELASVISHELKAPIMAIRIYTHLLANQLSSQNGTNGKSTLESLKYETQNLLTLVHHFLDADVVKEGKLALKKEKIDMGALVDSVIADFLVSLHNGHRIIKKGRAHGKVMGDPVRLRQVVVNLVSNAIKYSPKSDKVVVKISEKGKEVIVSVQDTGVGISKRDQKNLFKRFSLLEKRTKKSSHGLGLYISSGIIEEHGGVLKVRSVKGKGSTFSFALPKIK